MAIIDLDGRAAQPMHSKCGRYVIVFNGEIYNYIEIRELLEGLGCTFSTTSDTEVILALFSLIGEKALERLRGMFAFAIWDREERRAFAARDPYGIKPLYLAKTSEGILLGSQVRGLIASGLVSREPDARGQAGYWMLGSVPEPRTWYRDISALPAGHYIWIKDGRVVSQNAWADIGAIWRKASEVERPKFEDVEVHVAEALRDSVAAHLVADVPVGVFLSGGVDSSALTGLMRDVGAVGIKGITVAYSEYKGAYNDESPYAASVAKFYGVDHAIRIVTKTEFEGDFPSILSAMDQPSIDGVNTWYAAKAASEMGLKVVVSGVGGDELFQGYLSFRTLPRLVRIRHLLERLPFGIMAVSILGAMQARRTGLRRWGHLASWLATIEGAWWLRRSIRAPEELEALMGRDLAYEALKDFDPHDWVQEMTGQLPGDLTLALSQIESMTYLRNQLLRDSDWATMYHGVELRTPLVDSFLLSKLTQWLPAIRAFPGKGLLSNAPRSRLPRDVSDRRKVGFEIPVKQWTRLTMPMWQAQLAKNWSVS